jgi:hypothetical protein
LSISTKPAIFFFLGELTIAADDGGAGDGGAPTVLVDTDHAWRASKTEQTDWTTVAFDDSSWVAASEIANNGDPPWGAVFGASTAKWIWSAPVPASTGDKPNLETAFVRRTFYFDVSGTTIGPAPVCP